MKVKVIKMYIDANTRERMDIGRVIEYSEERARGLIEKGFVEDAEKKAEKKAPKKEAKKEPVKKAPAKKTAKTKKK